MPTTTWFNRWGYLVTKTTAPGILRIKDGRWLLYAKVRGKPYTQVLSSDATQKDAEAERLVMIASKHGTVPSSKPSFGAYATSLFKLKRDLGELSSAASIERWDTTICLHLLPAFGLLALEDVTREKIDLWKVAQKKLCDEGRLSVLTVNGWISILKVILRTAVSANKLVRDPTFKLPNLPTATHHTYTEEDPNSLNPVQRVEFMRAMRRLFPQFYAFTLLGFATGLRPSTLRAFRRKGPVVDILWDEKILRVRRANSRGQEVRETNKNGSRYTLPLPSELIDVLDWHVDELAGRRAAESDLLFPSKHATFQSRSALDKPFQAVSRAIHLPFTLTPRGMRRTFQDLARGGGFEKNVRKAVCGHESDEASTIYETISPEERLALVTMTTAALTAKPVKQARKRTAA